MCDQLSKIGINSIEGKFMVLYRGEQDLYYGFPVL